jgi:hypothetical protein
VVVGRQVAAGAKLGMRLMARMMIFLVFRNEVVEGMPFGKVAVCNVVFGRYRWLRCTRLQKSLVWQMM